MLLTASLENSKAGDVCRGFTSELRADRRTKRLGSGSGYAGPNNGSGRRQPSRRLAAASSGWRAQALSFDHKAAARGGAQQSKPQARLLTHAGHAPRRRTVRRYRIVAVAAQRLREVEGGFSRGRAPYGFLRALDIRRTGVPARRFRRPWRSPAVHQQGHAGDFGMPDNHTRGDARLRINATPPPDGQARGRQASALPYAAGRPRRCPNFRQHQHHPKPHDPPRRPRGVRAVSVVCSAVPGFRQE